MNIVTLLLIFMAGCALCWGVTRLPPPWRTVGIVVVVVIALLVLLSLVGWISPTFGQEPTPSIDAPAEEVEAPPPEMVPSLVAVVPSVVDVVDVAGKPVAIVPAPEAASDAQVEAVAEQASDTLESVASGEVTIAQATRDPSETLDPGAGQLFFWLSLAFGAIVRPKVVDPLVRRMPNLSNEAAGYVSVAANLAFFTLAFYALRGVSPALPQTLGTWLAAAGVSVMGGSAASSFGRARANPSTKQGAAT